MREQEHEEASTFRRRAQKVDTPAAAELRGHADLLAGAAGGQAGARQDPQDAAPRRVRRGPHQDDLVSRVSGKEKISKFLLKNIISIHY